MGSLLNQGGGSPHKDLDPVEVPPLHLRISSVLGDAETFPCWLPPALVHPPWGAPSTRVAKFLGLLLESQTPPVTDFLNDATEIDNVTLDNIIDNIKGLEDENFLLRESLKLEKERFKIENEKKVSIQNKLVEQKKQMEDIKRSKKSDDNPAESDRSASDKNANGKKVVGFL
jgi:hypothetical protein